MKWSNNASYSGMWLAGKRHGTGVHTFPYVARAREQGPLRKNTHTHAHTTHAFSTGEKYEGEWKEGIRHGVGRRHYPDGSVYEGGWANDKKHGKAVVRQPHGALSCAVCVMCAEVCCVMCACLCCLSPREPGRFVYEMWDHGSKLSVAVAQGTHTHILALDKCAREHANAYTHYVTFTPTHERLHWPQSRSVSKFCASRPWLAPPISPIQCGCCRKTCAIGCKCILPIGYRRRRSAACMRHSAFRPQVYVCIYDLVGVVLSVCIAYGAWVSP